VKHLQMPRVAFAVGFLVIAAAAIVQAVTS
jgi:hypothetical protein